MPKVRWLKSACGRTAGHAEENEEWLVKRWLADGLVEIIDEPKATPVPEKHHVAERAIEAPPVDKAMKSGQVKKK